MKILVAGGGIGGLVAAIALSQRGLEVEVLEQQAEPREVGAGIAIAPNGARVLTSLGIDNSIAPVLHSPAGVRLRSGRSGRLIVDRRLDSEEARPGARSYNLHRGDLRQALLAAALACPNVAIRLGQRVVSISEEPKRIRVETHAGS